MRGQPQGDGSLGLGTGSTSHPGESGAVLGQAGPTGPQPGLAPYFGQRQVGVGMSPAGFGHRSRSVPRDPGPPEAILSPNVFPCTVARPGTLHPASCLGPVREGFAGGHTNLGLTTTTEENPAHPLAQLPWESQHRAELGSGGVAQPRAPGFRAPTLGSCPGSPSPGSRPWAVVPRLSSRSLLAPAGICHFPGSGRWERLLHSPCGGGWISLGRLF